MPAFRTTVPRSRHVPLLLECAATALTAMTLLSACDPEMPIPHPVPSGQGEVHGARGARVDSLMTALAGVGYSGTLLVIHRGDTLVHSGYGWADRRARSPATEQTLYDVGSVGKTITAATVLRLVDAGRLRLDDTVGNFLPAPPDKSGIALRHLLTHTAGLPTYHDEDVDRLERDEALERILGAPLLGAPGTTYSYSNSGYTLLAAILESAVGRPFRELVREQVLRPAGARATFWYGDDTLRALPVAHGYADGRDRGTPAAAGAREWTIMGAGGVLTTVGDLARLAAFYQDSLSPTSWTAMTSALDHAYPATRFDELGLGWRLWRDPAGNTTLEKGGYTDRGFTALLRLVPATRTTIVLALNTIDLPYPFPHNTLVNRIARELEMRGRLALPPAKAAWTADVPEALAGAYETGDDEAQVRVVLNEAGRPMLHVEGQRAVDALLEVDPATAAASHDANGRTAALLEALTGGFAADDLPHATDLPARVREELTGWLLPRGERPREFAVLGSSPEWFHDARGTITYAQLDAGRRVRLHWDGAGQLIGVGGGTWPAPFFAPVLRTPDGFVAHHLGLGRNTVVQLRGDTLLLRSEDGNVVRALRTRE